MNTESTDQVQGQESTSLEASTTLQNQFLDTSNIQLQNSAADGITQDCSVDKIQNLTSSLQISDSQQSTTTQASCEAQKSLISNLFNILVCDKLPATEKTENFNKKLNEFIDILEALSESCGCDKISSKCSKNCDKIEIMTNNVQLRIKEIKNEKSTLLIEEEKLEGIAQKYEKLKEDEALMKILFHNCYDIDNNAEFKELKNFQSGNQKFIFRDLCDTFERVVVPNTQKLFSSSHSKYHLTWKTLSDTAKSTIMKSYIDYQGFYFPLEELIGNHPNYLNSLNSQQIIDILQNGFTKVSKIEHRITLIYLMRTFIPETKNYFYQKLENGQTNTKVYQNLKEELKSSSILIFADNFGTGKSTNLKNLARRFKEDDNNLWISYIDAKSSAKIFERIAKVLNLYAEYLGDFLAKILQLTGIEVPIFMKKFMDSQVILLWDNIDEKFQPALLNFALKINQMTENQQVFATRFQYSEKLTEKFNRQAYKQMPLTTPQFKKFIRKIEESLNFPVNPEEFLEFCDLIEFGQKEYDNGRKMFINIDIQLVELIMHAIADLKVDINSSVDLFLLFDRIFVKQLMDCPQKLTKDEKVVQQKFLQAHALKTAFDEDKINALQIVKNYSNIQPPISSLEGIFAVNFNDNSVDFQHEIFKLYFVTKFIIENVLIVRSKESTVTDSKILVRILAMIISKHNRILSLINNAIQLKYTKPDAVIKLEDNLHKLIKKAQYWPFVTEFFHPLEPKFIDYVDGKLFVINDFEFWMKLLTYILYSVDNNYFEIEKSKKLKKQISSKKENKNLPAVKGTTSMKKLNYNHEISNQFDEFLEDQESDESYDVDEI